MLLVLMAYVVINVWIGSYCLIQNSHESRQDFPIYIYMYIYINHLCVKEPEPWHDIALTFITGMEVLRVAKSRRIQTLEKKKNLIKFLWFRLDLGRQLNSWLFIDWPYKLGRNDIWSNGYNIVLLLCFVPLSLNSPNCPSPCFLPL